MLIAQPLLRLSRVYAAVEAADVTRVTVVQIF